MGENIIQILIQGGSVGVAILAILVNYKIVSNHINHNTQAMVDFNLTMVKMGEIIKANTKSMDRNTDVMERVERIMDKSI